jgi:hypothetical protein
MIELKRDSLVLTFPEVHPEARLEINFQRTLRIPDDGKIHYLPPGLGNFPLKHGDDFAGGVPAQWLEHGGVMLPMHQAEAMWLLFHSSYVHERRAQYPFAVKIAMEQEIYADPFDFEDWDRSISSRCFVHIANSLVWRAITGQAPPTEPPTAAAYTAAGLPREA